MKLSHPTSLKHSLIDLAVRSSIIAMGLTHANAHAADILVTSIFDDNGNGCTLREAINSANNSVDLNNGCAIGSASGVDRVVLSDTIFASNSVITLSNGQLQLDNKNIDISAASVSGGVTISANNASRVMQINGGSVRLENLTIADGNAYNTQENTIPGGGLNISNGAVVNVYQSHITNNQAVRRGGGISLSGSSSLTLNNSSVTNNATRQANSAISTSQFRGGGIYVADNNVLTVNDSIISENTVGGGTSTIAGGLYAKNNNSISITNSSISNNNGNGISIRSGTNLDLIDSVLDSNRSRGSVAALDATGSGDINIIRSTIKNHLNGTIQGIIEISDKNFYMVDSTISNNLNAGFGNLAAGGLELQDVNGTIENSTFSNNTLAFVTTSSVPSDFYLGAGAAMTIGSSQITLNNVTAFENRLMISNQMLTADTPLQALDNAYFPLFIAPQSSVSIQNSIIHNSTEGEYNSACGFIAVTPESITVDVDASSIISGGNCGALRSGDPGLLPLADNGGPTQTNALAANSIAINTGDTNTCLDTDQRGEQRDTQCDVGAFERLPLDSDPSSTSFIIPLPNGKTVIFDL